MAVAQASGEVGTDSVVCIRASGYPKDFAGIASVAKETFHFPFQYQTGERHRHFRLFLHRDSECVFLREVIPVSKAFFLLRGRQEQIEEVFRYFGLVDVLCSVSELRDGLPYYVLPEACSEGETFHAEGLYHPLIERCIPNDITLCGKSVLVAGSNMSGKTTFIRAIGLNLLSAQVLHTCFARSFRFPMDTALYSAIHLEDSLMEGKVSFCRRCKLFERCWKPEGVLAVFPAGRVVQGDEYGGTDSYSQSCAVCFGAQEQYCVCFHSRCRTGFLT